MKKKIIYILILIIFIIIFLNLNFYKSDISVFDDIVIFSLWSSQELKNEWEYYIDDAHDIQDTNEGKNVERYIFKIEAIIEE